MVTLQSEATVAKNHKTHLIESRGTELTSSHKMGSVSYSPFNPTSFFTKKRVPRESCLHRNVPYSNNQITSDFCLGKVHVRFFFSGKSLPFSIRYPRNVHVFIIKCYSTTSVAKFHCDYMCSSSLSAVRCCTFCRIYTQTPLDPV